jgi:Protein of unknown function (DUF2917)
MTVRADATLVRLTAKKLVHLHDAQGHSIASVRGTVWVTQSNDVRDIVLEPGDSFELDRPGLALVTALSDATIVVTAAATAERLRTREQFATNRDDPIQAA